MELKVIKTILHMFKKLTKDIEDVKKRALIKFIELKMTMSEDKELTG